MTPAPDSRVRTANDAPIRPGRYVLYWMIAARRARWNFGLQHAIARAKELGVGLVVYEPLRATYPWASPRFHRFAIDGMHDNAAAFEGSSARYVPYVEPMAGAGRGLLTALSADAALVVTDHFPCFVQPRRVATVAGRLSVRVETVDGNGLIPLSAVEKPHSRAHGFRWFLQKTLPAHLDASPVAEPLAELDLPRVELPELPVALEPPSLEGVVLASDLAPVELSGGMVAADAVLQRFLADRLPRYADGRNHPEDEVASGLSPWLHWGHVSAHEVAHAALDSCGWTAERLGKPNGSREGWWGASPAVESFLDELITWRELGYSFCDQRPDYDDFDGLPEWALKTLADHADDPRDPVYTLDQLDRAQTHDELWNAAQRQLVRTGTLHNYLRMLWGKKVLHWSATPRQAFDALIELNNRYALDGRDPNSYSGIAWCFGRFDRAWGPERPIFGKIRYMTSASTRKKLRLGDYLERFGP